MNKFSLLLLALTFVACGQYKQQPNVKDEPIHIKLDSFEKKLNKLDFAVNKDLVCGMPLRAGISDTFTYKNKLYGFCASECKEEFMKSPMQYIAANQKK